MYLFSKLSKFHGTSQKILHCDLRIPESRESFPGLMLKDIIHSEEMINTSNPTMTTCPQNLEQVLNIKTLSVDEIRDIKEWSHLTEKSVKNIATDALISKAAPDMHLPGKHTMGHTAPTLSSHHVPRKKGDNNSRPKGKRVVKIKT